MERKKAIRSAYRLTGGNNFYDGMITCSTLSGKAVCRLVWDMNKEENDAYLEKETGDVRFGQRLVKRHGQNAGAHRHLQQLAGKMLWDAGQRFFQIGVVFRLVHVPHQAATIFMMV